MRKDVIVPVESLIRRSRMALSLIAIVIVSVAMCATRGAAQEAQTLDTGAVIHVTVAGETDISSDYTVGSDGNIEMLYVNTVHVGGETIGQANTTITKALTKYYRNPQVVVTLIHAGGITVQLNGDVVKQGDMPNLRSDTRLNDILQQSDPALDADLAKVQITHGKPGDIHTTDIVDYLAFLDNNDPAGNPELKDGDVVYVPKKEAVQIDIAVRGEVLKGGRLTVPANTTAYDAITLAGGLTPDADRTAIYIQHAGVTTQTKFDFDTARYQTSDTTINPVLLDGDTVIVNAAAIPEEFTITGSVRNPSEYPITGPKMTLADAIGKAGGLGDRPQLNKVTITRTPPGEQVVVLKIDAKNPAVQATTLIEPGDNIVIPQGTRYIGKFALELLGVLASVVYAIKA